MCCVYCGQGGVWCVCPSMSRAAADPPPFIWQILLQARWSSLLILPLFSLPSLTLFLIRSWGWPFLFTHIFNWPGLDLSPQLTHSLIDSNLLVTNKKKSNPLVNFERGDHSDPVTKRLTNQYWKIEKIWKIDFYDENTAPYFMDRKCNRPPYANQQTNVLQILWG